jgi:hypothetical protein
MSEFTKFEAIEPVVIEAKAADTFDKYWLSTFIVRAPSPTEEARCSAVFKLYSSTTGALSPDAEQVNVDVPNLFAEASTNELVAAALEAVFVALKPKLDDILANVNILYGDMEIPLVIE